MHFLELLELFKGQKIRLVLHVSEKGQTKFRLDIEAK